MRTRMNRNARFKSILDAGVKALEELGSLRDLTRLEISDRAGCSVGTISHYFGDMESLRWEVVNHGILAGNVRVALIAIVERHELAKHIPESVALMAAKSITES